MRDYLPRRPHDSFLTLLTDDQRFRNSKTSSDAYAESWSLVYFLMRQQPQAFVKYLQAIGAKEALGQDSPEQRLAAFKAAFGEDVADVERNFLRAVSGWSD